MERLRSVFALLLVVACGGAQEPTGPSAYVPASLEITYDHPDVESYTYTVTCEGDRATLRGADLSADEACSTLSELSVRSRLVDGPADEACPEIYGGPDVATLEGTIEGEEVSTVVDRTDGCGISDWDNLLAGLLPVPAAEAGP